MAASTASIPTQAIPQSLHKYLYCHANPVNAIDPSGMMTYVSQLAVVANQAIVGGILAFKIMDAYYNGELSNAFGIYANQLGKA